MKATELRIGNLIHYEAENDNNQPVNHLNVVDGEDIYLMSGAYAEAHKPIPLTEQWLIDLGFEKQGALYELGKFAVKEWTVGQQEQWQLFWGDCHLGQYDDMKVHQLQNLYFALTGEEFELNK